MKATHEDKKEKRGKKRRADGAATTLVDVLVKDYADNWVRWLAHMDTAEGRRADDAEKKEVWEHLRPYKKKMDTWPQKERRKAFRKLYRKLRPLPQSGALSLLSSAPSIDSPLALPQLEQTPHLTPSRLCDMPSLDDHINLDSLDLDNAASGAPHPDTRDRESFSPPAVLTVHQTYHPPAAKPPVLAYHLDDFHYSENDSDVVAAVKRIVDTDVNYLVNHRPGGHVAIGIDAGTVKGYFMTRKMRDKVRLAVDSQLARWDPPPHLLHLVDPHFVDVQSSAGKPVADHCVIWFEVRASPTPIRNTRGELVSAPRSDPLKTAAAS
eukprot:Rhum_TRINITY_DN2750_c0_g1::Rhum_TRINITY_DN2750_c0_g1_i1::g.8169::m.8169